jgi:hypothetical protein
MNANESTAVTNRASFLGPARALAVQDRRVLVALPQAKAWATLALAQGYEPVEGDVLLVIGQEEAFFVIGVIAGRGRTTLRAHGDLELSAPHGRIDLLARDGIALRGGPVQVVAKAFEAAVDTLKQRCKDLFVAVTDTFRTRSRRLETEVEETHRTTAGRIVQRAEQDVTIDGEKIHLG